MDVTDAAKAFMDGLPQMLARMWMIELAIAVGLATLAAVVSRGSFKMSLAVWPLALVALCVALAFTHLSWRRASRFPAAQLASAEAEVEPSAPHHTKRRHARSRPPCYRVLTDPNQSTC